MSTSKKLSKDTPLMDILGYVNPFVGLGKETVEFRAVRVHDKRNGDTFVKVPGTSKIQVPRIQDGEIVLQHDGKTMVMEEAVIAFIPGARSIFASEIISTKTCKDFEEVIQRAIDIDVFDGAKVVQAHEINEVAYLRACSYNTDNLVSRGTPIIYEYDKSAEARKFLKSEMPRLKVVEKVKQWIEENRENALWAMFANFQNLTIAVAQERYTYEQVQAQMLYKAKHSPEQVEEMASSQKAIDRTFVLMALHTRFYDELPDGSIYSKDGIQVARKGQGGNVVDAILNQLKDEQLKDLRVAMTSQFKSHANKFDSQSLEIENLKKQNEILTAKLGVAKTIPTNDLISASKGIPTEENALALIEKMIEEGKMTRKIQWLSGEGVPGKELNPLKPDTAFNAESLTAYYLSNPVEFWELYNKHGVVEE